MAVARLATHEWPPSLPEASAAGVAVLVHGITGWHRTWWRVGPALAARGWRVVAVDQRGHGRSPRIDGFVTIADFAGDLAAAIEGVGAPVEALIGHSLGASVSVELAHRRPELVHRLVLEDPPTMTRAGDVVWLDNFDRELQAAHADPEGEVARELAANPAWLEGDARQDIEGKQLADRVGLLATIGRDTGARVPALLPQLTVPALVILAAEDRSVFRGEPRRRLEREPSPGGRVAVVDAGHTIHRDRFDDYLTAILDWIEPSA